MDKAAKILSGIPDMSYGNPSPVCYIGAVMRLLAYIGEGVLIPYPEKYWTAEVQFDRSDGSIYNPESLYHGDNKPGEVRGGYLFSVDLGADGGGK